VQSVLFDALVMLGVAPGSALATQPPPEEWSGEIDLKEK
jgi:hypothetical protein